MALRIKSRWHGDGASKSMEEKAGALAFIIWRIALHDAKQLHGEGYVYESDSQRVTVIAEFLAFLLHLADRIAHGFLEDAGRTHLITALGRGLAGHVQDNLTDLFGPGDYQESFIATLNERLSDYAELSYDEEGGPSYGIYRYFGERVMSAMGPAFTNRWVIDQVMDIQGPEAYEKFKKAMLELFS